MKRATNKLSFWFRLIFLVIFFTSQAFSFVPAFFFSFPFIHLSLTRAISFISVLSIIQKTSYLSNLLYSFIPYSFLHSPLLFLHLPPISYRLFLFGIFIIFVIISYRLYLPFHPLSASTTPLLPLVISFWMSLITATLTLPFILISRFLFNNHDLKRYI